MNCYDFELIVVDLARGEVTDSALGTRCRAHAASCSRCAGRLLDQEKLTAGFEALSAHEEQARAPERIEAVLRREFRSQRTAMESHGLRQ